MTNSQSLADQLSLCRCKHDKAFKHGEISGSLTKSAESYPLSLCKIMLTFLFGHNSAEMHDLRDRKCVFDAHADNYQIVPGVIVASAHTLDVPVSSDVIVASAHTSGHALHSSTPQSVDPNVAPRNGPANHSRAALAASRANEKGKWVLKPLVAAAPAALSSVLTGDNLEDISPAEPLPTAVARGVGCTIRPCLSFLDKPAMKSLKGTASAIEMEEYVHSAVDHPLQADSWS